MAAEFCPNCFRVDGYAQKCCSYCGYREMQGREQQALPKGEWLENRYLLGRVLGVGGFGITYLAYDRQRKIRCAIKEYFPVEWSARSYQTKRITPNGDSVLPYENGIQLFIEEANLIMGLRKEQAVVDVFDFFETNGTVYMVMEYIEGVTLSSYMREHQKVLPPDEAGRMLEQLSEALLGIHQAMLLHRDISPDNIIRKYNGEFKLIDFGSTRAYAPDGRNSFSVLVKPGFAPIEQYSKSGEQGPWTDIYSLAATYYYALTGKKIPSAPERELGEKIIPLRQFVPALAERIERTIMRALSVDYRKRQRSMQEFLNDLAFEPYSMENMRTQSFHPPGNTGMQGFSSPGNTGAQGFPPPGNTGAQGFPSQGNTGAQSGEELYTCLVLQYSDRPNEKKEWRFVRESINIGRNREENQICLNDKQISGKHCMVWLEENEGEFYVTDFSTNGTYTTKGKLEKGQSARLHVNEWFYLQTKERRYIFYLEVK